MAKPRDKLHDIDGRLFQAKLWRQYAMALKYDRPTDTGVGRAWVSRIAAVTYERCLRQYRVNIYLARRLNRRKSIDTLNGV